MDDQLAAQLAAGSGSDSERGEAGAAPPAAGASRGDEPPGGGGPRDHFADRCPSCGTRALKRRRGALRCYKCGHKGRPGGDAAAAACDPAAKRARTSGEERRAPAGGDRLLPHGVVFAYTGTGYKGLQWNVQQRTVEGQLVPALRGAGIINWEPSDADFQAHKWTRASRTDAGVHATVNLVALRCPQVNDPLAAVQVVNTQLEGSGIRVMDVRRVMGPFDAREAAGERTYRYLLPAFATCGAARWGDIFAEDAEDSEGDEVEGAAPDVSPPGADAAPAEAAPAAARYADAWHPCTVVGLSPRRDSYTVRWADGSCGPAVRYDSLRHTGTSRPAARPQHARRPRPEVPSTVSAEQWERLAALRPTEADREHFNEMLSAFVGRHSFHNFTSTGSSRNKAQDSLLRNVAQLEITDTRLVDGIQSVVLTIRGTSFIIHQIRAMVGAAVACIAARLDAFALQSLLDPREHRGVPLAPPEGLWLDGIEFGPYNRKLAKMQRTSADPAALSNFPPLQPEADPAVQSAVSGEVAANLKATAVFMRQLPHLLRDQWGLSLRRRQRQADDVRPSIRFVP
eukprot:TRINITY_DN16065_c0_g1_i2.p1 TRINITY_DN16065_c0_g1~~TRINITY_DN16065_c0_g1_i2.p1  ORF type:complete len:592 (+),score=103.79 TRINITY_DN16065_c0_g1_i2:70-1776(+)